MDEKEAKQVYVNRTNFMNLELSNYEDSLSQLNEAYVLGNKEHLLCCWRNVDEAHTKMRLLVGVITEQHTYSNI